MKYELLTTNNEGIKIYARIDEDGKCRFTCTEDNPEYQAWLNPVEHLTEIIPSE
jgi:hypothetical protein